MNLYKILLKPFFFLLSPEKAHAFTLWLFETVLKIPGLNVLVRNIYKLEHPSLNRTVFGLDFPNPIGLAAGFDKNGKHFEAMSHLGFGFIEVGTVTPKPQTGNPQPRLFRLPADDALINRMGFNNEGLEELVHQLKRRKKGKLIVGGNIGKNKITPNEEAWSDYQKCFEALFPYVDYFVVNVSSPNTPNLRALQEKEPLTHLLSSLQDLNLKMDRPKPLLLKIAPDLSPQQLDDIVEIAQTSKLDGLIATNTTISRDNLRTEESIIQQIGAGGLSGQPVKDRSTEVIRYLHQQLEGSIPIIGVGGIASPQDALEKLEAGAALLQVYSGLIYEGPGLIKQIKKGLLKEA